MLVQGVGEKDYRMIARSLIGLDATGAAAGRKSKKKSSRPNCVRYSSR